jgi:hypothetical protein
MSKELATTEQNQTALMESVLIAGDLSLHGDLQQPGVESINQAI